MVLSKNIGNDNKKTVCRWSETIKKYWRVGAKKETKIDETEIIQMVVKVMAEKNKEMEKKIIIRIWVTQGFQKVNPSGWSFGSPGLSKIILI